MKTHDLGRLYTTRMNFPTLEKLPFFVIGWTAETEEPWRIGRCVVVRIPGTRTGLALGVWGKPTSETESLTLATGMRRLSDEEADDLDLLA